MIAIATIQPHQYAAARAVMEEVTLELWGMTLNDLRSYDPLPDTEDIQGACRDRGGAFFVVRGGNT